MGSLISKVEDRFQIRGQGCIVVPGVTIGSGPQPERGDALLLKRPDGTEIRTRIKNFDIRGLNPRFAPIVLGDEIDSSMVPVGTELWTLDVGVGKSESSPAATREDAAPAPETVARATEVPGPRFESITAEGEAQDWTGRSFIIQRMPGPADDGSRGEYVALIRTKNGQFGKFIAEITWNTLFHPLRHEIRWRYCVQFDDGRTGYQVCVGTESRDSFAKLLAETVPLVS